MHTILQPEGWAKPIGYANGMAATGRMVFVGGQVGWNAACEVESDDFVEQGRQTFKNVVALLKAIGQVDREVIGRHFPAMAAMQVVALVEDRAKIEIQATAIIPE